jgi:hypothetical protein
MSESFTFSPPSAFMAYSGTSLAFLKQCKTEDDIIFYKSIYLYLVRQGGEDCGP